MKIKIQSIRDFFKSKEKKGLKPIFFESIGGQNTSRDEKLKNLIKVLEKNGFKIKNKKQFLPTDLPTNASTEGNKQKKNKNIGA